MKLRAKTIQRLRENYGPWALVTGATSGIGRELALKLGEAGFKLVITGRREAHLQSLATDLFDQFKSEVVTLPGDFCIACHSEGDQDVRVNRPTHAELEFDTCATAGCHNFHDNRALYEDFLVKHAGEDWIKGTPIHTAAALAGERMRPGADEIESYLASLVAPEDALGTEADAHWAASAHAAADVGCGGCHAPDFETCLLYTSPSPRDS